METFLFELMKAIATRDQNLSDEQVKALAITEHLKRELFKINDLAGMEIQEHWYHSAKDMLKDVVKSTFYRSLKLPERSFVKSFKRVNKKILENIEKTIRSIPDSILKPKNKPELTNHVLKNNSIQKTTTFQEILPVELTTDTRGYISKISKQINSTYKNNDYDACSIMMRRLFEVMLILVYRENNNESSILNQDGKYKSLNTIINITKSQNTFAFSKTVLETMHEFRKLGNHSAHRIEYNCLKPEIDDIKKEFRVSIEEMLYKSNIKT